MNFKLTLGLVILLVAVTSIFLWVQSRPAETTKKEEKKNALLSPAPKAIDAVSYARDGEVQVSFTRSGEKWMMQHPVAGAGVENWQVQRIADMIKDATYAAKFEPEATGVKSLSATGLDNPRNVISFTDDAKKERKLSLGKRAGGGGVYAKLDGANTIYLIEENLVERLDKDPTDFRNKTVAEVPTEKVQTLTVQTREQKVALKRVDGKWTITAPVPARVNTAVVDALLGELRFLRAESFTPLKPESRATGLNPAVVTVTVTYEKAAEMTPPTTAASQPAMETFALALGNFTDTINKTAVYARVNGGSEVIAVNADALGKMQKGLNDLRDPAPLSAAIEGATGLTIKRGETFTLNKNGEAWQLETPVKLPADSAAVGELLTTLKNLRASKFVDGAGDLKTIGLEPPTATVSITMPNTPQQEVLLIGKPEKAEPLTPVMRQGESTVYLVRTEDLAKLAPTTTALRDKAIERINADAIREIEVAGPAVNGGKAFTLKREGADWQVVVGGKATRADDVKATSLVSELAPVTVIKWFAPGEMKAAVGGEVTVKLTLVQAENKAATTLPGAEAVGPAPVKTETRLIRMQKMGSNWVGMYEGGGQPAWPFEPSAALISKLTATTYEAPATQPATATAPAAP